MQRMDAWGTELLGGGLALVGTLLSRSGTLSAAGQRLQRIAVCVLLPAGFPD